MCRAVEFIILVGNFTYRRMKRKYILGRPVLKHKYQKQLMLELIPREGDQCADDAVVIRR